MRRLAIVLALALGVGGLGARPASASVVTQDVAFTVTNPLEPLASYTVRGTLYRPASDPGCTSSVMLLSHGLSYGRWGWDFPIDPDTYSVARALAARGYPSVAIDELGYGASDHPNGYTLTVQSYAAITSQIVRQLRTGTYTIAAPTAPAFAHVGLMGHSAGTEISELTAGIYGGVDVLVATAYTHFPSYTIVRDFITGDVWRAFHDDYEYFGGSVAHRARYMYNLDVADPAIVDQDTALANLTPSGEVWSISNQPSRWVAPLITVPVLLVLAEKDLLFPIEQGPNELSLFASSPDASQYTVPTAGHSFMLHPNAPQTNDAVADWLDARQGAMPVC